MKYDCFRNGKSVNESFNEFRDSIKHLWLGDAGNRRKSWWNQKSQNLYRNFPGKVLKKYKN